MDYIFHYTKPKNALNIISERTLLFNNINNTNDPYENKMFDMHIKEQKQEKAYDYSRFYGQEHDIFKSYEDVVYPEEDEENYYKNLEKKMRRMEEDYMPIYYRQLNNLKNGIVKTVSFSMGEYYLTDIYSKGRTGYLYPRMWSQYGNNSKGICIVFKKDMLLKCVHEALENDYHIFNDRIEYVDIFSKEHTEKINRLISSRNRMVFSDKKGDKRELLVSNMIDNIKLYFFRKDNDWIGENEYRFLIINKNDNKDFNEKKMAFDIDCIKSIIFGEDADINEDYKANEYISFLMRACRGKITMYKLKRSFNKGKYFIEKI